MKLFDIRTMIERVTGDQLENDWIVQICNDAQTEFSLSLNIPDTDMVSLTTSDLEYPLPTGLKIINRLWLQSDFDAGIDKEFKWPYRIYNGKIIFRQPWMATDTLNIDFYKHMKYFTDVDDVIDIEDRFSTLYTSYGLRERCDLPSVKERLGESQARQEWQKQNARYVNIKEQVTAYYSIQDEPVILDGRW